MVQESEERRESDVRGGGGILKRMAAHGGPTTVSREWCLFIAGGSCNGVRKGQEPPPTLQPK